MVVKTQLDVLGEGWQTLLLDGTADKRRSQMQLVDRPVGISMLEKVGSGLN